MAPGISTLTYLLTYLLSVSIRQGMYRIPNSGSGRICELKSDRNKIWESGYR